MKKRWGILLTGTASLMLCSSLVLATTVKVDGVGDGDGDFVDDFDTISAAIQSLGALGIDASPDVVNVVVDVLDNHPAILVNGTSATIGSFPVLTDDITIDGDADGNGTECRLALASAIGAGTGITDAACRFDIELATTQKVTVKNFTIIPQTLGAGGGSVTDSCINVDEAETATVLNGAEFNLDNCVFTASADASNTPLDTTVASSGTPTFFAGNTASLSAYLSLLSNPSGAQVFTHTITNCVLAHGRRDAILIACDSNATGTGTVNISDSRFSRTVFGGLGDGIFISSAEKTTINLTRVRSNNHDEHGLIATTATTTGNVCQVNLNEGCQFDSNTFRGVTFGATGVGTTSRIRVKVTGTALNPVLVNNNSNRGFRTDNANSAPATQFDSVDYLIVRNNGIYGLELNEFDHQYPTAAGPTFTNCIFSRNGSGAVSGQGNVRVADTNAAAGGGSFIRCTFYDPGTALASQQDNFSIDFSGADSLTYNFTDCIFAGSNDFAVRVRSGDTNTVNLTNCVLAALGADPLNSAPTAGFPAGVVAGAGNTLNSSAVITADPVFASSDPTLATFLDVRNGSATPDGLAGAANLGGNLSGAADFVGDGRVKAINTASIVTLHGIEINTSAFTGTSMEWVVYNPAVDPGTLSAPNFPLPTPHDTTKYWDIAYYPATALPTTSLTLNWPDGVFTDDNLAHIFHLDTGDKWEEPAGATNAGVNLAGDPNTVTYSNVTEFSPFAVADVTTSPVELDSFAVE